MADENLDSDYHGRPHRPHPLTIEWIKEEIKRVPLPPEHWDLVAEMPDGSRAVHARGGWYALDEDRKRPDFDRPVEVPEGLY